MTNARGADRGGRSQPGAHRRDVCGTARRLLFHQRRHRRSSPARTPSSIITRCSRRASTRSTSRRCTCTPRGARTSRRTPSRSAGGWCATTSNALLDGEGAECTLNGLYLADGERLVDNHTTIDHAKPHCPSHEIYKGILGGKARAVFNGKIIVRQDAQKTDAKQTNRALLLSDDALDQHEAAARDLRRRREVHARGGDRAAGRRCDLLPAGARPDVFRGARHADPRVRRRDPRTRADRLAEAARSKGSCTPQLAKDLAEIDAA